MKYKSAGEATMMDRKEEAEWIHKNMKNNRLPIDRPLFDRHISMWVLQDLFGDDNEVELENVWI